MSASPSWISRRWKSRRSAEERAKRIRMLNAELDVRRVASSDRTKTIETKATFVVAVAALLASVTGLSLVTLETFLVGLIPLGLMVAAVASAMMALWPRKLDVPSARSLVDTQVESPKTADELDDFILEVKAKEITKRDDQTEERAKHTARAFKFVFAGLVFTLLVVALNALSPIWSSNDEAEPTQTPVSTQAPTTP
ncbi:hypothetical protein [Microbacterium sp. H1-D42]|uniref:hypothetical protein n=1 Tax=Microbacterium sp. H1-D42 TaxID=2925844 RepID=UPI001F52DB5E|nr:hypothetical protein [Microbacterium sp. H1-D42]UNK71729.1 hypothetical protein MNR00_04525 [Microbacterium sp. H1-D42]